MSIDYDSVTDNQEPDAQGVYREIGGFAAKEQDRDGRAEKDHTPETARIYFS
ncbi:MAG: hypothetical protein JW891_18635 [Candidatus Lokiarchaeota archaeon]|nr:hypothetical protein [Candidatus Lokiarchaeota archaeon]